MTDGTFSLSVSSSTFNMTDGKFSLSVSSPTFNMTDRKLSMSVSSPTFNMTDRTFSMSVSSPMFNMNDRTFSVSTYSHAVFQLKATEPPGYGKAFYFHLVLYIFRHFKSYHLSVSNYVYINQSLTVFKVEKNISYD